MELIAEGDVTSNIIVIGSKILTKSGLVVETPVCHLPLKPGIQTGHGRCARPLHLLLNIPIPPDFCLNYQ
jgi:hypothetical protein